MEARKLLSKYAFILLIYVILIHFVQPYGLRFYYSLAEGSQITSYTLATIQSFLFALTLLLNLIIMLIVLVDSKQKRLLDFLIAFVILFSAETGVILFLIWQTYKLGNVK